MQLRMMNLCNHKKSQANKFNQNVSEFIKLITIQYKDWCKGVDENFCSMFASVRLMF